MKKILLLVLLFSAWSLFAASPSFQQSTNIAKAVVRVSANIAPTNGLATITNGHVLYMDNGSNRWNFPLVRTWQNHVPIIRSYAALVETNVWSVLIPGGSLGKNGSLQIFMVVTNQPNSTNQWLIKLGGTNNGVDGTFVCNQVLGNGGAGTCTTVVRYVGCVNSDTAKVGSGYASTFQLGLQQTSVTPLYTTVGTDTNFYFSVTATPINSTTNVACLASIIVQANYSP